MVTPRHAGNDRAFRLIVAYKLVRAAVSLGLAALLATLTAAGEADALHRVAEHLRRHATSAWSIHAADALVGEVTARHLWLVTLAFALDGAFVGLEGWSLHKRWWWGPWLVVVATAAFLPLELLALVRRPALGRLLLLVVNVAVAVYLGRRALHDRPARLVPPPP